MSEVKIQDYILDIVNEGTEKRRISSKPEFNVLYQDCGDFVISRKTKTTEDQLVVICSQHQFYIKKVKGGSGTKQLTEKLLCSFVNGIDGMITLPGTYFEGLPSDRDKVKALFNLLTYNDGIFAECIKQGVLYVSMQLLEQYSTILRDIQRYTWRREDLKTEEESFNNIQLLKKLLMTVSDQKHIEYKEIVKAYTHFVFKCDNSFESYIGTAAYLIFDAENMQTLLKEFGAGGIHDFLEKLLDFDYTVINSYYTKASPLDSLFHIPVHVKAEGRYYAVDRNYYTGTVETVDIKYNPKDFFNYLTYQPYIQGYDVNQFISDLSDVLSMENFVFGKITDKYPKNLASLHQKLSTECSIIVETRENEIYKEMIETRHTDLLPNTYAVGNAAIMPANSREEILDIAKRFNNCLASYVDRYANGNTDIYFMYRNDIPEVAIEIKDGKLRQAFQAQNTRPNKQQFDLIRSFCDQNQFLFNTNYTPC